MTEVKWCEGETIVDGQCFGRTKTLLESNLGASSCFVRVFTWGAYSRLLQRLQQATRFVEPLPRCEQQMQLRRLGEFSRAHALEPWWHFFQVV